ncbi:hypothetical protein PoB_007264900 [Plakobranchus ocellatus]|uniref:Uncharacterized protein n=1 Tax=Plakobranchus ocellatus TaxID=259542 RepID=A0AAV4DPQ0_9GAST|nr:hypothetical protein PoB_007264900 [Plakobranchus ocellatus]
MDYTYTIVKVQVDTGTVVFTKSGNLCNISPVSSWLNPDGLDITEDGDLVCSTAKDTIAKVQVDTGTVVFNRSENLYIISPVGSSLNPADMDVTEDGDLVC